MMAKLREISKFSFSSVKCRFLMVNHKNDNIFTIFKFIFHEIGMTIFKKLTKLIKREFVRIPEFTVVRNFIFSLKNDNLGLKMHFWNFSEFSLPLISLFWNPPGLILFHNLIWISLCKHKYILGWDFQSAYT